MLYQVDHKVGPSRMKAENDDEKIFFVNVKNLTNDSLMQQKVNKFVPSCDILFFPCLTNM
jgi:hypothetical protein